jgi:polar amino acid transport system substrate-binding protein
LDGHYRFDSLTGQPFAHTIAPMLRFAILSAALALGSCAMTDTSPTDTVKKEFAPTGTLRAAVNFGNIVVAQKDSAGGDPRGVGPQLARELARRLGVPIRYVTYDTAGKVADAVKDDAWDVAFLAADPKRTDVIAFSAPYVLIEGTYLVHKDSPRMRVEEFDRPGVRIAAGLNTAYDLYLTRELKQAQIVRAPTSEAAVALFRKERLDAAAGVRNYLVAEAREHPDLRVIGDSYMVIAQAAGVPKSRANAARYLAAFIEEAKASGFVAGELAASGVRDVTVAPPAR